MCMCGLVMFMPLYLSASHIQTYVTQTRLGKSHLTAMLLMLMSFMLLLLLRLRRGNVAITGGLPTDNPDLERLRKSRRVEGRGLTTDAPDIEQ